MTNARAKNENDREIRKARLTDDELIQKLIQACYRCPIEVVVVRGLSFDEYVARETRHLIPVCMTVSGIGG